MGVFKKMYRRGLIFAMLAGPVVIWAQEPIDSFAERMSHRMAAAAEKRDLRGYDSLFAQWDARYMRLSEAEKRRLSPCTINAWYNYACTYALSRNASRALDCLEQSIRAGYADYSHIMQDSDLETIRGDARFLGMVAPLRATGDYLYILRRGMAYKDSDRRGLPVFTYQSAAHPALLALRKAFNLDSVAGGGNEASRVLSLLHWVHNLVPHDGNHENPMMRNAMQMIAVCRKEGRGLNCRGLATVLNEACLALGYASRMVTCLPKDSLGTDGDCHVINAVYLPSLKKWVWMDPTNDAYLMDERGGLLGIAEARERIIRNEPLIVNPDANWNHRVSTEKRDYLYRYMAKNLYILECPVSSEYDLETRVPGKELAYIRLLPLDYFRQGPDRSERTDSQGTKWIFYTTNNAEGFWQAPAAAGIDTAKTTQR